MEQTMADHGLTDPAVDAQIGHEFGTKDMVGLAGWCLLLVFEFLALQALCNLVDWLEAPPKTPSEKHEKRGKNGGAGKGKDAGGKTRSRSRRTEDYDEVDDEDKDESDKDEVEEEKEEEEEQASDDGEGNGASSGDDSDSDKDRRRRTSGRSPSGGRSRRA